MTPFDVQPPSIPAGAGMEPFGSTGTAAPIAPPMSSPMAGPAAMMPALSQFDPTTAQYAAETQIDGTVLLRIKNPDGSLGPVVAHLPVPKMKGVNGQGGK